MSEVLKPTSDTTVTEVLKPTSATPVSEVLKPTSDTTVTEVLGAKKLSVISRMLGKTTSQGQSGSDNSGNNDRLKSNSSDTDFDASHLTKPSTKILPYKVITQNQKPITGPTIRKMAEILP